MSENDQYLALASDHAGFHLKECIKKFLESEGYIVMDYGCYSGDSIDYPDVIHPLANDINCGKYKRGIILCGSGIGVSIVANKYDGVRAALCCDAERAELCRLHNDANVLAIGARFVDEMEALKMCKTFLTTSFEGGRHQKRVDKIKI